MTVCLFALQKYPYLLTSVKHRDTHLLMESVMLSLLPVSPVEMMCPLCQ